MSVLPTKTPRWIEWRTVKRKSDGKALKVPFNPITGKRVSAYEKRDFWARAKIAPDAKAGFVLGSTDDESAIIGIDLDTCRSKTGKLEPWAREALDEWGSYAEISPSQTGVKAFARVDAATFKKVRKQLGGNVRRTWAIGVGEHPPGIMLALGGYFAVTDDALDSAKLRTIDIESVQRVIEIGKRIQVKAHKDAGVEGTGWTDESGSGESWRLAVETRRSGGSFEDFAAAVEDHPEALRSLEDSPRGFEGQLERDWKRASKKVNEDSSRLIENFEDHSDDADDEERPKKHKRAPLEIFWGDADDGADDLEPLIEGVFFKHTVASIYGPYGVGKSFVALDAALHVATGREWFGHKVTSGAVMYLAGEGYYGLKRRRAAWCKHHKLKRTPANFALVRGTVDLQKPGDTIDKLADVARQRGAALIVMDTLNAVFGGADENDSAAMSKARHALERLRDQSGATVLIIHHAGKDLTRGLRGSSVLGGALDTILLVNAWRISATPPQGKQKDCEPGDDMGFSLQSVDLPDDKNGNAVSSAVVIPAMLERFEDHDSMTEDQRTAVAILRRLTERTDVLGPLTREAYREALRLAAWGPPNSSTWRSRFRNLMQWLARERLAEVESDGGLVAL